MKKPEPVDLPIQRGELQSMQTHIQPLQTSIYVLYRIRDCGKYAFPILAIARNSFRFVLFQPAASTVALRTFPPGLRLADGPTGARFNYRCRSLTAAALDASLQKRRQIDDI